MKRFVALLLVVVMAAALFAGCAGQKKDDRISISLYAWDRSMFKELTPLAGGEVP